MRKVLVIGCPGAGKSTLAPKLAQIAGVPVVHLDRHYWRANWQEPDKETWRAQVAALIAEPAWIMDGNYGGTLPLRLAAADTVVFLDFPAWRCLARVLWRTLRSFGRVRCDMAPGCREHIDLAFLKYVYRYRRDRRADHLAAASQAPGKLVVLRSPADVTAFLQRLP